MLRIARRILLGLTVLTGAVTYVWVTAVRSVPGVKRRKAAARDSRRNPR